MKYSLGLDIGVTSIGWAVIDEDKKRIHDLGVRIFELSENKKNRSTLASERRVARSTRRRLKRRRQRLDAIKRFFISRSLLDKEEIEKILLVPQDPYSLRVKALDERLTNAELFVALYHIAKRRGYQSNRRSQEEKDPEGNKFLSVLDKNESLLTSEDYRTVGEALLKDERFKEHKRNKSDDYANTFYRKDLLNEFNLILKTQKEKGFPISDADIEELLSLRIKAYNGHELYYGAFAQRPFMTAKLINEMVGRCTFESDQKRIPKGSFTFEKFWLLQTLVQIRILHTGTGELRKLNSNEIKTIVSKALSQKTSLTYASIRKLIDMDDDEVFETIKGAKKRKKKLEKGITLEEDLPREEQEKTSLKTFAAFHELENALKNLPEDWSKADNPDSLDAIAYELAVNKTDEDITKALSALPEEYSKQAIDALCKVKPSHFTKFGHLSKKALENIIPWLEKGLTYDAAVKEAKYDFEQLGKKNLDKLPALNNEELAEINSTTVRRAISEVRKVVNAIIDRYGAPYFIKLECSRDLAKSSEERQKIERLQNENRKRNEAIVEQIKSLGFSDPTGTQITKLKLYEQQSHKCLYSGRPISDLYEMLKNDNIYQIDHVIPWSRSGLESMNNKVLVRTSENQDKGNLLPREAFGNNKKKWSDFEKLVESLPTLPKAKKNNLLLKTYKAEGWMERALNDTRYISRFLSNYIRRNLKFAEGPETQRVIRPNGALTAYLRRRWGVNRKDRDENVLHHAADAAVIAAVSQKTITLVNLYAKKNEIKSYLHAVKTMDEQTNLLTGEILDEFKFNDAQMKVFAHKVLTADRFVEPWKDFSKELSKRLLILPRDELQNELRGVAAYDEDEDFRLSVKPVFVSRAPQRKIRSAAHKETLLSPKFDPKVKDSFPTVRKSIKEVNLDLLEKSVLAKTQPNGHRADEQLYRAIKERLEKHDNDSKKAFEEPLYKKDKNGNDKHQIRSIKIYSNQKSGYKINQDKAFVNNANNSIIRVDIFQRGEGYFAVPVYNYQVKKKVQPTAILPARKGFSEIDESFEFKFSLYKNDVVKTEKGIFYFNNYDITGRLELKLPYSAKLKNKEKPPRESISTIRELRKFTVDPLGSFTEVKKEKRPEWQPKLKKIEGNDTWPGA